MNSQEALWAGAFGDEYIERNQGKGMIAANVAFLARALQRTERIGSCIEFGAGTGMTLEALKTLRAAVDLHAIEINAKAIERLSTVMPRQNIFAGAIRQYVPARTFDLVLTKGVLIAAHPDDLQATYERLHAATGRYLLISEYYNPTPVEIPYRGNAVLWKRDFAGEIMDAFPDLFLLDYGFYYRRDPRPHPMADATWFLMERRHAPATVLV